MGQISRPTDWCPTVSQTLLHIGTYTHTHTVDFTEARDSEWQWHLLGYTQVCTLLQSDNHVSTPPLNFLQARCPSCRPTNSVKVLKAEPYSTYYINNSLSVKLNSTTTSNISKEGKRHTAGINIWTFIPKTISLSIRFLSGQWKRWYWCSAAECTCVALYGQTFTLCDAWF